MKVRDFDEFLIGLNPEARGERSPDGLKYGDLDAEVRGVATTWIASMEMLRCAVEQGVNLVITHEPTFWCDGTAAEPELKRCEEAGVDVSPKTDFLDEHGITVLRAHNVWDTYPDHGIEASLAAVLGLDAETRRLGGFYGVYEVPQVPLRELARDFGQRVRIPCVRVAGDLDQPVRSLVLAYGATGGTAWYFRFRQEGADAVVCGESGEWPAIRPALDMGLGVIELGHQVTEEFGMASLARLLQEHFPGVSIKHIPAEPSYHFIAP